MEIIYGHTSEILYWTAEMVGTVTAELATGILTIENTNPETGETIDQHQYPLVDVTIEEIDAFTIAKIKELSNG